MAPLNVLMHALASTVDVANRYFGALANNEAPLTNHYCMLATDCAWTLLGMRRVLLLLLLCLGLHHNGVECGGFVFETALGASRVRTFVELKINQLISKAKKELPWSLVNLGSTARLVKEPSIGK